MKHDGQGPATAPTVVWSVTPDQSTSPYIRRLVASLGDLGWNVESLSLQSLLASERQIVHIQWPEHVSRGPGTLKTFAKHLRATALLAAFKARKHTVVVTAHNIEPHGESNRFDALFREKLIRSAKALVVLVPQHEDELRKRGQVSPGTLVRSIRHPFTTDETARHGHPSGSLLVLGQIHPYRQVLEFVDTLIAQGNTRRVNVAGQVGDEDLLGVLQDRERSFEWLSVHPGYLSHDDLETMLDDTAAVISLQRGGLNSGGPFFALPNRIPVVLTEGAQANHLATELGTEWIFEAPKGVTSLKLDELEAWINTDRPELDLTNYSANAIAQEHVELYELLSNSG